MPPVQFETTELGEIEQANLGAQLGFFRSLEDLLAWSCIRQPQPHVVDIIEQDEYTLDVVVDLGAGLYAVFDTT